MQAEAAAEAAVEAGGCEEGKVIRSISLGIA